MLVRHFIFVPTFFAFVSCQNPLTPTQAPTKNAFGFHSPIIHIVDTNGTGHTVMFTFACGAKSTGHATLSTRTFALDASKAFIGGYGWVAFGMVELSAIIAAHEF
jgi:hypothetical protein